MSLQRIFEPLLAHWPAFASLLGLLGVVKFLGIPAFKGWIGEWMVCRGLKRLDAGLYRQFHDLYLPRPDGTGTTQIDHVIVSPYGIFVIETKNYKGWIFGSEKQRQWTQQIYRTKHRFQNPLHQNHLHVKALMSLLDLPADKLHPVIFFIGGSEFKTPMPANVINRGLLLWITNHTEILLDPDIVRASQASLDSLRLATDRRTVAREHVRSIHARNA